MSDSWQRRFPGLRLTFALCALGWPSLAVAGTVCYGVLGGSSDPESIALVESIASARIIGPSVRVYFVLGQSDKTPTCPSMAPECRARAFLVPGNDVLIGSSSNGFHCATYRSSTGVETGGYLPAAAIALPLRAEVKPVDWVGTWRRDRDANIKLTLAAGGQAITVDGDATWGSFDPQRVKRGAVHEGNLDETAVPHGNLIALGQGYDGSSSPLDKTAITDCLVRLRLFGRYLVVEDNQSCGGANVSFTGVYTRMK